MKPGIHKRLYTVLSPSSPSSAVRPRPYYTSSSLPLSFFDSPPPAPPPSRLPSRIPTEPKHNNQPNPLALTLSPPADQDVSYTQSLQYQSLYLPKHLPSSLSTVSSNSTSSTSSPRHRRTCIRYQLDVGAYGIPKRCRHHQRSFLPDDSSLAVSIGEDAYFIRDNAMGVADGVGGWARNCTNPLDSYSSPSALFARRLMHYTSAELSSPPTLSSLSNESLDQKDDFDPESELESHLSELSEGIDVLQILERAYERTVNAHVQPQHSGSTPLHTGSSTALVAVLDHIVPSEPCVSATASKNYPPLSKVEPNITGTSRTTPLLESRNDPEVKLESPASVPVVKIAHIGDCMGMLVRGEEIIWRSEEMWWAVRHFQPVYTRYLISSLYSSTLPCN
jgi:serine/threonine protein phosphatase PrpC